MNPTRDCRKKIGPGETILINAPIMISKGRRVGNARMMQPISRNRLASGTVVRPVSIVREGIAVDSKVPRFFNVRNILPFDFPLAFLRERSMKPVNRLNRRTNQVKAPHVVVLQPRCEIQSFLESLMETEPSHTKDHKLREVIRWTRALPDATPRSYQLMTRVIE